MSREEEQGQRRQEAIKCRWWLIYKEIVPMLIATGGLLVSLWLFVRPAIEEHFVSVHRAQALENRMDTEVAKLLQSEAKLTDALIALEKRVIKIEAHLDWLVRRSGGNPDVLGTDK